MTTIEQVQKAKLKQIHERAVELYGQGEAEKIKQYKKFLIINNTSLTMIQVGEIIDEYMAGVETGKLAHEVYVGKKEQLDVNLEFTKKYTVDIEYLGEVIKFTFEFVGYVKGPSQKRKIKTEREKLLEKKLMAQKEQVEKMDKKKSSGTKLKTPILCVDTGVLYESFTACEKDLGLSKGTVRDFLKGQASRIRTKGYRFMLYDADTADDAAGNRVDECNKRRKERKQNRHDCSKTDGGNGSIAGDGNAADAFAVGCIGAAAENRTDNGADAVAEKGAGQTGVLNKIAVND